MMPRIVVVRSLLIGPENAISTSVAPAMTNQVLTSWLLTTSPRLSASSSRFWVGSSVLSVFAGSSAMQAPVRNGSEIGQHAVRDNRGTYPSSSPITTSRRSKPSRIDSGNADEEHLHLRHQPRQHAEPEIEQEPEHQERRRQLDADAERGRNDAGHMLRATSPISGNSPG